MAAERLVEIVAINLAERIAARSDDILGDIRQLLDSAYDETDDPEEAIVAIVEWRDDAGWSPVELALYERKALN